MNEESFRAALRSLMSGEGNAVGDVRSAIAALIATASKTLGSKVASITQEIAQEAARNPAQAGRDAVQGAAAGVGNFATRGNRFDTPDSAVGRATSALGQFGPEFSPAGDVAALADAFKFGREGDTGMALLAGAGAIPLVPNLTKGVRAGEMLRLRHYGKGSGADVLDPSRMGSGQAGRETLRPDRVDRAYAYAPGARVEERFRGGEMVEFDVDPSTIATREQQQVFVDQARAATGLEGAGLITAAEKALVDSGEYTGMMDKDGIVQLFTPVALTDAGKVDLDFIDAIRRNEGATMRPNGEDLGGQKLFAVAANPGDDFVRALPEGVDVITPDIMREFRAKFADDLAKPDHNLGGWVRTNKDGTKEAVLDVARTDLGREDAMKLGKKNGQDAIFDLENYEELTVPKPGQAIPGALIGGAVGGLATEDDNRLMGALGGAALGAAAPSAVRGLRGMGEAGHLVNPAAKPQSIRAQAGARERAGMGSEAAMDRTRDEIRTGLLPHELANFEKMNSTNQKNFMRAYLRSPAPREIASLALQGASQRGWYEASAKTLQDVFGDDATRFAAVLASTSPKAAVSDNLEMTMNIWKPWVAAGRPTDPDAIYEIMKGASKNGEVLEAHRRNTIKSLQASEADLLSPKARDEGGFLSGPKVDPFWANLIGETQRTVNDTHMARGWGILPSTVGTAARGGALSATMRNAAEEIYKLTGQRLTGREIQEMTWGQIRAMTMAGGPKAKGGSGKGALDALANDAEYIKQIGDDTPSFATLLSDPKFSGHLEALGMTAPDAAGTAAKGMDGFDPSLIRDEDIKAIAGRIEIAKEAERRQKLISDRRKLGRSTKRLPKPNPLFGIGGLFAGQAVHRGVGGLFGDPNRER